MKLVLLTPESCISKTARRITKRLVKNFDIKRASHLNDATYLSLYYWGEGNRSAAIALLESFIYEIDDTTRLDEYKIDGVGILGYFYYLLDDKKKHRKCYDDIMQVLGPHDGYSYLLENIEAIVKHRRFINSFQVDLEMSDGPISDDLKSDAGSILDKSGMHILYCYDFNGQRPDLFIELETILDETFNFLEDDLKRDV